MYAHPLTPNPVASRPIPDSPLTTIRATWDIRHDGAFDREVAVTYGQDQWVRDVSSTRKSLLEPVHDFQIADVRRYVDAFTAHDSELQKLPSSPLMKSIPTGNYQLVIERPAAQGGTPVMQVLNGKLANAPQAILDVLSAASQVYPHLRTEF